MNNYRPLLTFGAILILVVAGFWIIFRQAASYNHHLETPAPKTTATTTQPQRQNTSPSPKVTPKASTNTPSNTTTPSKTNNSSPSPSSQSAAPQAGGNSSATASTHQNEVASVPKAGSSLQGTLAAALGMTISAFLLAKLRRQTLALRPNR